MDNCFATKYNKTKMFIKEASFQINVVQGSQKNLRVLKKNQKDVR